MKIHNGLVAQLTSVLLWVCATGYAPTLMWAQDPTVEWDDACANDDATNCTDWVVQPAYELVLGDPDCAANIHYKTRTCSTATGQVYKDYVITGWEYLNGCEGWDKKSKYEQSFDGLKDYILLGLLTQLEEINPAPCSLNPGLKSQTFTIQAAEYGLVVSTKSLLPSTRFVMGTGPAHRHTTVIRPKSKRASGFPVELFVAAGDMRYALIQRRSRECGITQLT